MIAADTEAAANRGRCVAGTGGGRVVGDGVGVVRDARPGEDAVLFKGARLAPLSGCCLRGALGIVVEARHDVAGGGVLEVGRLFVVDLFFLLGLLREMSAAFRRSSMIQARFDAKP